LPLGAATEVFAEARSANFLDFEISQIMFYEALRSEIRFLQEIFTIVG
jgi:hypothetical protein